MPKTEAKVANQKIVGRYAPSPTGAMHLGNLRTALLAWLQVRLQGGEFLLRMEDLDTPRVVEGSAQQILNDLEWLGLDWDGEVIYQSQRLSLYQEALDFLDDKQLIYPCYCSRKDIQLAASAPHTHAGVYSGLCRNLSPEQAMKKAQQKTPALRFKVTGDLARTCGDFVVKRADDLFAYQLAVVVDDLEQGVTHVLRGQDLANSTERQLYLAKVLEPKLTPIHYTHVPLMLDESGVRLSKRDGSLSVNEYISQGKNAEALIGEFALELGFIGSFKPISAQQLLVLLQGVDDVSIFY